MNNMGMGDMGMNKDNIIQKLSLKLANEIFTAAAREDELEQHIQMLQMEIEELKETKEE